LHVGTEQASAQEPATSGLATGDPPSDPTLSSPPAIGPAPSDSSPGAHFPPPPESLSEGSFPILVAPATPTVLAAPESVFPAPLPGPGAPQAQPDPVYSALPHSPAQFENHLDDVSATVHICTTPAPVPVSPISAFVSSAVVSPSTQESELWPGRKD